MTSLSENGRTRIYCLNVLVGLTIWFTNWAYLTPKHSASCRCVRKESKDRAALEILRSWYLSLTKQDADRSRDLVTFEERRERFFFIYVNQGPLSIFQALTRMFQNTSSTPKLTTRKSSITSSMTINQITIVKAAIICTRGSWINGAEPNLWIFFSTFACLFDPNLAKWAASTTRLLDKAKWEEIEDAKSAAIRHKHRGLETSGVSISLFRGFGTW